MAQFTQKNTNARVCDSASANTILFLIGVTLHPRAELGKVASCNVML